MSRYLLEKVNRNIQTYVFAYYLTGRAIEVCEYDQDGADYILP